MRGRRGKDAKPYKRVVACKLLWKQRSPGGCAKFCFLGVGERQRVFYPAKRCKDSEELAANRKGRIRQERAPLVCWHLPPQLAGFAVPCWHRCNPKLTELLPPSAANSGWSGRQRDPSETCWNFPLRRGKWRCNIRGGVLSQGHISPPTHPNTKLASAQSHGIKHSRGPCSTEQLRLWGFWCAGPHNTHCGALSPLHPSLPTFLLPMAAGSEPQPGHEGSEDGGQSHTGCGSLCAATSHSHCDSSAPSSARLMLLPSTTGRGGGGSTAEGSAVHPPLSCRDCLCPARSLPSVYGRSRRAGTGEGEERRGSGEPSFANRV